LLLPVAFLNDLENPPAVLQFLDRENHFVRDEIVNDVLFDKHSGRYKVNAKPGPQNRAKPGQNYFSCLPELL
jgi:hypothetical protein